MCEQGGKIRFSHFCVNLAQTIIHRCFVKLELMLMFAQTDDMRKLDEDLSWKSHNRKPTHYSILFRKGSDELPRRFAVRGMYNDLAILAHTDAFRTHSRHVLQRHMHDAAFARGHGIQAERLARRLDALGGNAGGHAQFFKTKRAVPTAIDVNFFMVSGFQAQRPEGEVFERFQDFGAALEQEFFVFAVEIGKNFGVASRNSAFNRYGAHGHLQLQSGNAHHILQKKAQGFGRRLPVQLAIVDEFLSHGAFRMLQAASPL